MLWFCWLCSSQITANIHPYVVISIERQIKWQTFHLMLMKPNLLQTSWNFKWFLNQTSTDSKTHTLWCHQSDLFYSFFLFVQYQYETCFICISIYRQKRTYYYFILLYELYEVPLRKKRWHIYVKLTHDSWSVLVCYTDWHQLNDFWQKNVLWNETIE